MRIAITCGPSFEPIDDVRRITNFSTGRLGVFLSNYFASSGHEVTCFKGEMAVAADPVAAVQVVRYSTNSDLANSLERTSKAAGFQLILHAAALCDFRIVRTTADTAGQRGRGKISSAIPELQLNLEPAPKILPLLREWNSTALIVGWKYEVEGDRAAALHRAWQQIASAATDACVVNGPAWGSGFGLCVPPAQVTECSDSGQLADCLMGLLMGGKSPP